MAPVDKLVNVTVEPAQIVVGVPEKSAIGGVVVASQYMTKLYIPSSQSFVAKETFPVKDPPAAELKFTVKVVVAPAAIVVDPNPVPKVYPVPVTVIGFVNVKLVVPELVTVNVATKGVPAGVEPKSAYPPSNMFTELKVTSISPGVVALNRKLSR